MWFVVKRARMRAKLDRKAVIPAARGGGERFCGPGSRLGSPEASWGPGTGIDRKWPSRRSSVM